MGKKIGSKCVKLNWLAIIPFILGIIIGWKIINLF